MGSNPEGPRDGRYRPPQGSSVEVSRYHAGLIPPRADSEPRAKMGSVLRKKALAVTFGKIIPKECRGRQGEDGNEEAA